ncbi:MAG: 5'-3' exonuclease H3TH domain-containing protein [Patescibacteria group bacterium]|nr:5'-3' exonuclease H3TH domain-containing protein [Patescibacteria group bacterium]
MTEQKKRLIIVDCSSVIYRAYYALPPLTNKQGELINAVYGFFLVFLRILKEFHPYYIAPAFDLPGPTFRHKQFKEYKAKRIAAPPELYQQIPKIKEILKNIGLLIFEKQGFEADDLIASIANYASQTQVLPKIETIILSGDFDLLQLVDKQTRVYMLTKGLKASEIYDIAKVKEVFGFFPKQVIDFKALAGDQSDNIPGATGIGKKTALNLVQKYGSVFNIYEAIKKGEAWEMNSKTKDILLKNKEQVFLSMNLAETRKDALSDFNFEKSKFILNKEQLKQIFEKNELPGLSNKI